MKTIRLNRPAPVLPQAQNVKGIPMPRLGAPLVDGRFAGIVRDPHTEDDVALVDLGLSDSEMTHAQAVKWAAERGGELPTREEARVLWGTLDSRAAKGWGVFWTSTQSAGYGYYAWCQFFPNGHQYGDHKGDALRARAVRRLPLQPFDHSVISS